MHKIFFFFILVYQDVYGIPRLIQTLHIHQWPNMNLKGKENNLNMSCWYMIISCFNTYLI
jgi:hypothetical protein